MQEVICFIFLICFIVLYGNACKQFTIRLYGPAIEKEKEISKQLEKLGNPKI